MCRGDVGLVESSVGNNISVLVSGLSLSGAAAGNYSVTDASGAQAHINASGVAQLLSNWAVTGVADGTVLAPTFVSLSNTGNVVVGTTSASTSTTKGGGGDSGAADAGTKDAGQQPTGPSSSDASKPADGRGDKPKQATTPSFGGLFRSSLSFQLEGER